VVAFVPAFPTLTATCALNATTASGFVLAAVRNCAATSVSVVCSCAANSAGELATAEALILFIAVITNDNQIISGHDLDNIDKITWFQFHLGLICI
jgi:hypothetical protein